MAKVLLVDDSPAVLQSMQVALGPTRHEVDQANGVEEAWQKITAACPDVMVVDVMMPGGTEGFDLVWKIRKAEDERLRQVPIIMATGVEDQTDMSFFPNLPDGLFEPGQKLDVQGWLRKPVKVAALLEAIKQALEAQ